MAFRMNEPLTKDLTGNIIKEAKKSHLVSSGVKCCQADSCRTIRTGLSSNTTEAGGVTEPTGPPWSLFRIICNTM